MDPARARFLVSPAAVEALDNVPRATRQMPLPARMAELRRRWGPDEAAALSEQLDLQERAGSRFGDGAATMRFTAEGLEMATHPAVAARRAGRLTALGMPVFDLGCGIGSESRALAENGCRPLALDRDRATAILASHNLAGRGDVLRADVRALPFDVSRGAVVLDPSRRRSGGRRLDPAAFSPSWDTCVEIATTARAAAIKGPPGIHDDAVPADAELEFVQLGRDLREAAIYLGEGATPGMRRAVLLPAGECLDSDAPAEPGIDAEFGRYIGDPASCVTRAGLVQQLAARTGARMLDRHVAYLSADAPAPSRLVTWFEVLDVVPFSVKTLRSHLRAAGWRPAEIRRRAFPVEPDELRRLLGRLEGESVALICTTVAARRQVIVARPAETFAETV